MQIRDNPWSENRVLLQKHVRDLISDPRPSAWEKEFLISIGDRIITNNLTDKQLEILDKIKRKYRGVM